MVGEELKMKSEMFHEGRVGRAGKVYGACG
jgi:hypothetical protein